MSSSREKQKRICILDYGSGNVRSVFNAFSRLTNAVTVSNAEEVLAAATHVVLPGVGAFGAAMEKIRSVVPLPALARAVLRDRKPFLGICVGMQVLSDVGYEFGKHRGLGWIPGAVRRLDAAELPLPHIGWNNVEATRPSPLLEDLSGNDFYFVHSFVFGARDRDFVAAETEYGTRFASVVSHNNIFGVQFHPEKSQTAGLRLLRNFINLS